MDYSLMLGLFHLYLDSLGALLLYVDAWNETFRRYFDTLQIIVFYRRIVVVGDHVVDG